MSHACEGDDSMPFRTPFVYACESPGAGSPIYRITARVAGPRNTVSYLQGFVY